MVNTIANPAAITFAAIRFTVIDVTTSTVVYQTNLVDTNTNYIYPSVGVNSAGDVVVGMTAILTGPSTYYATATPASAAAMIGAETSPGIWTFNPRPTLFQVGNGTYTLAGNGRVRWGDYSATTPDPADPGVFWTTQEFATGGNWATQQAEVIVPKSTEARWSPSTSGTRQFATAANWYAGSVPASTDHVIFSRWASVDQTVQLTANTSVDRLSVRQTGSGALALSLGSGTTFTASNTGTGTPSLAVAEYQGQAHLTVTGGGTLATQTAVVAGQTGGTGELIIDGAGTTWQNAGGVYVGGTATAAGGFGTLKLTNGASATAAGPLTVYNAPSASPQNVVTVGTAGTASTLTAGGLTNSGAGPTLPSVVLANASSVLALTDTGSFSGVISGPGRVVKTASGNQTLSGANTYAGGTTLSGGTLSLASPTAVGTGTLAIGNNVVLANGTAGPLTLTANNAQTWGGAFSTTGPALDVGTGGVSISASPYAVVTVGAGGLTVGGPVGGTGVSKAGPGTLTLTGTNTYTGVTQVTAGTLALAGTGTLTASPAVTVVAGTLDATGLTGGASFGSAAAKYTVPSGQTLDGGGTVSGGLTVANGGTVRPGSPFSTPNSPLTVSAGSATFAVGSTLSLRVTDASTPAAAGTGGSTVGTLPGPSSNNFLAVTAGTLTLGAGRLVTVDGTGTAFGTSSTYSYSVAQAAGGATVGGETFAFVGFGTTPTSASLSLSGDNTTVYLNLSFTPVPEPALLLPVLAAGLAGWRRLRRGRATA